MTRLSRTTFVLLLVALLAAVPSLAEWDRHNRSDNQFILRGTPDEIAQTAARNGLTVLHQLDASGEETAALVEGPVMMPPEEMTEYVLSDEDVVGFEPVAMGRLPIAGLEQSTASILEQSTASILEQSTASILEAAGTFSGPLQDYFSGPLWNGYANQPAMTLLGVHEAHQAGYYGSGIIAIIDSGVDPRHPMLRGALMEGYDFVNDVAGASEWTNLDQSTASILEQSTASILESAMAQVLAGEAGVYNLEQSTASILEQSTASILEGQPLPPTFGHGTMVAGVIRLVAPGATLLPLKAFGPDGTAHMYDIVRAIYYAVANGARVINMSFSTEVYSPELARAINYAHRKGVLCISAAGNRSERVLTYPAALGFSVGVTSTSYEDGLSLFSNFGSDLVTVAAPGEAIITTFPGGSYAAASGTSFSTPLVAGSMALLADAGVHASSYYRAGFRLARSAVFLPELSSEIALGRLDVAAMVGGAARVGSR